MGFKRKNPAELAAQLASLKGGQSSFSDANKNEFKPTLDAAGNGSAVIRFLPAKNEDSIPFVKLVNHGFKVNGKWYIENCTSTHGDYDSCPVCQHISKNDLFNSNKTEYQLLKRKTSFWANVLVIKDPSNPSNEGKVMEFRFGQKIMDKINAMVEVDVEMGEVPVDVTCPFEGANFSLKIKKVSGFSNYDESKFYPTSEIAGIDSEKRQNEIIEACVDLDEKIAKDKFKTFDVNQDKFNKVLGKTTERPASRQADDLDRELEELDEKPAKNQRTSVLDNSSEDDELDSLLDDLDM